MLRWAWVILVALALPASAVAGKPGTWTRLHTGNAATAEPGLARTPDGALHVVWQRSTAPLREDVVHQAISPAGALVGSPTVVTQGWLAINGHVDLGIAGAELRAFWAGTTAGPLTDAIVSAASGNGGATWGAPAAVTVTKTAASATGIGALVTPTGTVAAAQGDAAPGTNLVHVGTGPDVPYETAGCCAYHPDIAVDSVTGQPVLGWFSTAPGRGGLWTQAIAASGLVGAREQVPGSSLGGVAVDPAQRTAITGRIGAGGVYVGYGSGAPAFSSVDLVRVGASPLVVARGTRIEHVGIAAAPEGRLWLFWSRGDEYLATRSNRSATRFETATRVPLPAAGSTTYGLYGEGSTGTLDLVAHAGIGSAVPDWQTQVLPRLSLVAISSSIVSRGAGKHRRPFRRLTLRVTDAGDPLAGVKVRLAGRTYTTNAIGRVTVTLASTGKQVTATVAKTGYATGSARVRL
jgi:hypothetical protein